MRKCQSCLMQRWRATAAASTVSLQSGTFPRRVPASALVPVRVKACAGCYRALQTSTLARYCNNTAALLLPVVRGSMHVSSKVPFL